jgi:hypothetical protein
MSLDLWAARMFLRLALKPLGPPSLMDTYAEHIVSHHTSFASSCLDRSKNSQERPAGQIKR